MDETKTDDRRTRRRPLLAEAAAVLDGQLLFRCQLLDISEAGARVKIGDEAPPDRFQLIDLAAGVAYSVRVIWRRRAHAGVAFLHARSLDAPGTPEWIVDIWRELRGAARDAA